jgi:hypothetical protein
MSDLSMLAIRTSGDGLWSTEEGRSVGFLRYEVYGGDDSIDLREIRVFFDVRDWDVMRLGLIYTDSGWLTGFQSLLRAQGFSERAAEAVEYSEQGMQGRDFVSLDAGGPFIDEWNVRVSG